MGGMSKWTDDQIEDMLKRMASGEPISFIERDPAMPSADTIAKWRKEGGDLSERIARAREAGYDYRAAKAVEDAKKAPDAALGRLAFDADRWFLSKMNPRKYGDKVTLAGDDENPLAFKRIERVVRDAE